MPTTYGIDPNIFIVGGTSAGAVMAHPLPERWILTIR